MINITNRWLNNLCSRNVQNGEHSSIPAISTSNLSRCDQRWSFDKFEKKT